MTVTAGDQLAAHVRHLFKLDEERQKDVLASLSAYSDKQRQEDLMAPAAKGKETSERAPSIPKPITTLQTESHDGMLSMGTGLTPDKAPTEPMKVLLGDTDAVASALPSPSQAPAGASWHKVVEELGSNLPKGATTILQNLLTQAETWDPKCLGQQPPLQQQGHASKTPDGKIAAVRLLMQQLEKDQEASVRKLHNMLGQPCNMNNGVGMNALLQPPAAFSLPFTKESGHESLRCKDLTGYARSGMQTAQAEQSFVDAVQYPSLLGGVGDMQTDVSAPHFGAMLFPGAEGHQQPAAEVGKSVGQSAERCFWQNSRRSGTMGQPQPADSVGVPGGPQETLRLHLRSLIHVDPDRVLIVRKINRLGFSSQTILFQYFSWYGVVERVLVAHSRVKSNSAADKGASPVSSRLRPSGLGFLVMSRAEDAQTILAHGSEQQVNGIMVRIQQFKRQVTADEEDCNEDGSETAVPETSLSEARSSSPSKSTSCEESN